MQGIGHNMFLSVSLLHIIRLKTALVNKYGFRDLASSDVGTTIVGAMIKYFGELFELVKLLELLELLDKLLELLDELPSHNPLSEIIVLDPT
jgi:hypothetical protein